MEEQYNPFSDDNIILRTNILHDIIGIYYTYYCSDSDFKNSLT